VGLSDFFVNALETHKGPPYISFVGLSDFFVNALETHKGPPYIFFISVE
jgi:hypothetical protein